MRRNNLLKSIANSATRYVTVIRVLSLMPSLWGMASPRLRRRCPFAVSVKTAIRFKLAGSNALPLLYLAKK